jgi:ATP-dependent Clp protease ATP-binding subunit ClpA
LKYFSVSEILNEKECADLMFNADKEMEQSSFEALGTEQMLLAILKEKTELSKKLEEYGITYSAVKEKLEGTSSRKREFFNNEIFCTPKLYKSLLSAYDLAKELVLQTLFPSTLFWESSKKKTV